MKLWQTLKTLFARLARNKPRVVLDTNILISATIVPHGAPARILAAALDGKITLIVSARLVDEYLRVIQRPHISDKYHTIAPRVQEIALFLRYDTVVVLGEPTTPIILTDPKDDFLIASAVEGKANYIVSGDEHLLQLAKYRGIKIVTPRDFFAKVIGRTQ
ncbi:MAG: putative toxin-antitoxin system toxin component, PIN family [Chloroflexota bacterium]